MTVDVVAGSGEEGTEPDEGVESHYVDDIPFPSRVHSHLSPTRMAYVAALNGFDPPRPRGKFVYCDLGCGNGLTVNALAAVYPDAHFYGVDFNSLHIEQACEIRDRAGLDNVTFIQSGFEELDPDSLPAIDFMGMMGVYSWLDAKALRGVHRILAENLKPGGLFCVEFMVMPGMIAVVPVWHLLQALAPPSEGDSRERAVRALRMLKELDRVGLGYLAQHPTAQRAVQSYVRQFETGSGGVDHFAHNALAGGFQPRYVNEVCAELGESGLRYGGRMVERLNDPELAANARQVTILNGIEDRITRELFLDFMRNDYNRNDLFVKDSAYDRKAALGYLREEVGWTMRNPAAAPARQFGLPGNRTASLDGEAYDHVRACMRSGSPTLRGIGTATELSDETCLTLAHRLRVGGDILLCQPGSVGALPEALPERIAFADAVTPCILERSLTYRFLAQLVSPVTGDVAMELRPREVVVIRAWHRAGLNGLVEDVMAELASVRFNLQINQVRKPGREFNRAEIRPFVQAVLAGTGAAMLRLGMIVPAPDAGMQDIGNISV